MYLQQQNLLLAESTSTFLPIIALILQSEMPNWLKVIGARPIKLGLDLRGGIRFLIQVN